MKNELAKSGGDNGKAKKVKTQETPKKQAKSGFKMKFSVFKTIRQNEPSEEF